MCQPGFIICTRRPLARCQPSGGLAVLVRVQPVVARVVGRLGEAHGGRAVTVADEHLALVVGA